MKWEYKVLELHGSNRDDHQKLFADLGNDNWKLVYIYNELAYFAKPAISEAADYNRGYYNGQKAAIASLFQHCDCGRPHQEFCAGTNNNREP